MLRAGQITKFLKFYFSLPNVTGNHVRHVDLKPILLISSPGAGKTSATLALKNELNSFFKNFYKEEIYENFYDLQHLLVSALSTLTISGVPDSASDYELARSLLRLFEHYFLDLNSSLYKRKIREGFSKGAGELMVYVSRLSSDPDIFRITETENGKKWEFTEEGKEAFAPLIRHLKKHIDIISKKLPPSLGSKEKWAEIAKNIFIDTGRNNIFSEIKGSFHSDIAKFIEAAIREIYPSEDIDFFIKELTFVAKALDNEGKPLGFSLPPQFKLAAQRPTILFFDELNRAPSENILNQLLQLMVDKNNPNIGLTLPPETIIIAAVNYISSAKSKSEILPLSAAMLDRLVKVPVVSFSRSPYVVVPYTMRPHQYRLSSIFLSRGAEPINGVEGKDLLSMINDVYFSTEKRPDRINLFEAAILLADLLVFGRTYYHTILPPSKRDEYKDLKNITGEVLYDILFIGGSDYLPAETPEFLNLIKKYFLRIDEERFDAEYLYDVVITISGNSVFVKDIDSGKVVEIKKSENDFYYKGKPLYDRNLQKFVVRFESASDFKYLKFCNLVFDIYEEFGNFEEDEIETWVSFIEEDGKIVSPDKAEPRIFYSFSHVFDSRIYTDSKISLSNILKQNLIRVKRDYTYAGEVDYFEQDEASKSSSSDVEDISSRSLASLKNISQGVKNTADIISKGGYKAPEIKEFFKKDFTKNEVFYYMFLIAAGIVPFYKSKLLLTNLLKSVHPSITEEEINDILKTLRDSSTISSPEEEEKYYEKLDNKMRNYISAAEELFKVLKTEQEADGSDEFTEILKMFNYSRKDYYKGVT